MKGEVLQVLNERMKTKDPGENEIYKFFGVEQADGIKKKEVNLWPNINFKNY